jgi:hypothetical protein
MEEERIPKKILIGKAQNTRAVGKPKIRWEEDVRPFEESHCPPRAVVPYMDV